MISAEIIACFVERAAKRDPSITVISAETTQDEDSEDAIFFGSS